MSRFSAAAVIVLGLLVSASSAMAHHSFAAEYDSNKQVTVKGVVQKVAWVNPHAYVFVDVKDESGKVTTWAFESLSPECPGPPGMDTKFPKQGEPVTVDGYLAKDGKPLADGSVHANSKLITTADGRKVFVGSSADDAATK